MNLKRRARELAEALENVHFRKFDPKENRWEEVNVLILATFESVQAETTPTWKPLRDYRPKSYAGFDELVLLGWESLNEHCNGAGGMLTFGVGWLSRNGWTDVSDKKVWSWQPTHFALVCQDISKAALALIDKPAPPDPLLVALAGLFAAWWKTPPAQWNLEAASKSGLIHPVDAGEYALTDLGRTVITLIGESDSCQS